MTRKYFVKVFIFFKKRSIRTGLYANSFSHRAVCLSPRYSLLSWGMYQNYREGVLKIHRASFLTHSRFHEDACQSFHSIVSAHRSMVTSQGIAGSSLLWLLCTALAGNEWVSKCVCECKSNVCSQRMCVHVWTTSVPEAWAGVEVPVQAEPGLDLHGDTWTELTLTSKLKFHEGSLTVCYVLGCLHHCVQLESDVRS